MRIARVKAERRKEHKGMMGWSCRQELSKNLKFHFVGGGKFKRRTEINQDESAQQDLEITTFSRQSQILRRMIVTILILMKGSLLGIVKIKVRRSVNIFRIGFVSRPRYADPPKTYTVQDSI